MRQILLSALLLSAVAVTPAIAAGHVVHGPTFAARDLMKGHLETVKGASNSGSGDYVIQGKIQVTEKGKVMPVPGLQVYAADHKTGKQLATAVSDASGTYQLHVAKPGQYEVALTNRMAKDIGLRTWLPIVQVVNVN